MRPNLVELCSLFFIAMTSLGLSSCHETPRDELSIQGPIITEIPIFIENEYRLTQVKIETLTNVNRIQGPAAQFFFMPTIGPDGELRGVAPEPRLFLNQKGHVVAGDLKSLELLTLYFHFEQLMKMDTTLGILNLNSWPRKVGLNARVVDKHQKISVNNARYSGHLDTYLFDSFVRPDLQLTVNGGVIAHEHFHSIFFKMVLLPSSSIITPPSPHENNNYQARATNEKENYYLSNVLRAWNEGLADVWGWLYSKDTNFVQRSIGFEKTRDLKIRPSVLPSKRDFQLLINSSHDSQTRLSMSYQLGSAIARTIFHSTRELDPIKISQAIVRILPKVTLSLRANSNPSPSLVLKLLAAEPELSEKCYDLILSIPEEDFSSLEEKNSVCKK